MGACPQCRLAWNGNRSRNRVLEKISRKIFPNEPEEPGHFEDTAQEKEDVVGSVDVPEVRFPTYDEMGFPDNGLDRF